MKNLEVSYLHVFTYSERANTTALRIDEVVPIAKRHERSKMLRILSSKKKRAFYQSQLNSKRMVLWEAENEENFMHGFTENYVKVRTPFNRDKINTTELVHLKSISGDGEIDVECLESIVAQ